MPKLTNLRTTMTFASSVALRNHIEQIARKKKKTMGEVIVEALAPALGKPSLVFVPRGRAGRPRTKAKGSPHP